MSTPTLLIIAGSTRPTRLGFPIAQWFHDLAVVNGQFSVEMADLAAINLPMFDEPKNPRFGQYEHEHTKEWSAIVARADAIVFVIPEYNHGYNAATKNAIDYLFAEWQHKPVGIVSYGGTSGGTRAAEQLKPVLVTLKMVPVAEVNISLFQYSVTDGQFAGGDPIAFGAKVMLDELLRWTTTLHHLRQT
jgi:NAD(P)H-dependent FMN reductase